MGYIETFTKNLGYVDENRTIRVYLPDGYKEGTARYPVVYMHDGQNVFAAETSVFGSCWEVSATLKAMEDAGETEGIIVVAIDSNHKRRFDDYSPWKRTIDSVSHIPENAGGDGEKYAHFVVHTLKPWIDSHNRTLPDRAHTAICGSSMGGLITAYIAEKEKETFSCAGVFSLASWFAQGNFDAFMASLKDNRGTRYFVQVGTAEDILVPEHNMPQLFLDGTMQYVWALLRCGVHPDDIRLKIHLEGGHNESIWAQYMRDFFLYFLD